MRDSSATVEKSAGSLVRGIGFALAILAFWTALSFFAAYYTLRLGIQPTWREALLSTAADYWTAAILCVPLQAIGLDPGPSLPSTDGGGPPSR